jgi:hypothetical protein
LPSRSASNAIALALIWRTIRRDERAKETMKAGFALVSLNRPPQKERLLGIADHLDWLAALALVDRHLTWRSHPILKAVGDHLAHLAACPQDFKRGLWSAYQLKDHPSLAPIPDLVSKSAGPHKFAEFSVTVDSVRLEDFRARMAKRFKRSRSEAPA